MKAEIIAKILTKDQLSTLTRQELIELYLGEQSIKKQLFEQLENEKVERVLIGEKYILIKTKNFCPRSEKSSSSNGEKGKHKKERKDFSKSLSGKNPNMEVTSEDVTFEENPCCPDCKGQLTDSGLVEESEYLDFVPAKFRLVKRRRHKYVCKSCPDVLVTVPVPPRIAPGTSYGDNVIIDVVMAKYANLIPIERYAVMAKRLGIKLPPNSLINLTHYFALFVKKAYDRLILEIMMSRVVSADETPHRMLEGHDKENWYLWGLSSEKGCYFEYRETRSGNVIHELLKDSNCERLACDVYTGYGSALKKINEHRKNLNKNLLKLSHCNAHARRKFTDALKGSAGEDESIQFYIDTYKEIYKLEAEIKEKELNDEKTLIERKKVLPFFLEMKTRGEKDLGSISSKSLFAKAINYFLNNFEALTLFLDEADLPIDNNSQERALRNPVIGRKTWYGTHSVKGSTTAAIIFSLIESCKLLKINPQDYIKKLTKNLHEGKGAITPWEYRESLKKGQ